LVAELRLSIVDLRSDITPTTSLVAALSQHVRRVGTYSTMTVHLSLDETSNRLPADVETELLRIAQEAIVNARKHSGAANLWVTARVHPPLAELYVEDDGCGQGVGRADSYGLTIMRERADRIDASFAVTARPGGGTRVSVELAPRQQHIEITDGELSRAYERVAS
jgi:signal transduction histidine kinase